jgi:hypothetical protein
VPVRVGQTCSVQLPDCDAVGVVVDRCESNHIVRGLNDVQSEGATLSRIDRELADELAVHAAIQEQIETGDGAGQDIRNEDLNQGSVVVNGEVPWAWRDALPTAYRRTPKL